MDVLGERTDVAELSRQPRTSSASRAKRRRSRWWCSRRWPSVDLCLRPASAACRRWSTPDLGARSARLAALFAAALCDLDRDRDGLERMGGAAARAYEARYTLDRMTDAYAELFEEVARTPSVARRRLRPKSSSEMCGSVGYRRSVRATVAPRASCPPRSRASRIAGPDDEGSWVDRETGVGLGFKRLAILDLSSLGHQPMVSSGDWVIVYNGEVYNFRAIRSDLERRGYGSGVTETPRSFSRRSQSGESRRSPGLSGCSQSPCISEARGRSG